MIVHYHLSGVSDVVVNDVVGDDRIAPGADHLEAPFEPLDRSCVQPFVDGYLAEVETVFWIESCTKCRLIALEEKQTESIIGWLLTCASFYTEEVACTQCGYVQFVHVLHFYDCFC